MMISIDLSGIELKLKREEAKTYAFDQIRKIWVILTPEEHVRQYFLHHLMAGMEYPAGLIAVEKKIMVGKVAKRFDIVVFNRSHEPWMLIECKEPDVIISETTLFQLLTYHRAVPCKYWVLTNGHQTYCADANNLNNVKWMEGLPLYNG
jgi:hypothetical protein